MKLSNKLPERLKLSGMSRKIKVIAGIGAVVVLLLLFFINSLMDMTTTSGKPKVNLVPQKERPKKNLNYDFIKLDTLQIPNFTQRDQTQQPQSLPAENFPHSQPSLPQPKSSPSNTPLLSEPAASSSQGVNSAQGVNRNPNMIVMNSLSQSAQSGGGSIGAYASGRESALIKVVIPESTPVADGSLVIARVLRDSKWGDVNIPRRTKLIGIASLFNNRVQINFREAVINDSSRTCTGKAYDLKQMEGIGYSPLSNEAKEILMDELRNVTSGVPVVGSVTSRAAYSGSFTQEVAELEEGLEFYALITAIY